MSEIRFSVDDPVYEHFMQRQLQEGLELAQASDLLRLHVAPVAPPHFVAEFLCNGLVSRGNGEVTVANEFPVGIWFPPDFLRRADPFEMLRNFRPGVWHPNVSREHPLICIGTIVPGTDLVDILHRLFDIFSYQEYNPNEFNSLNRAACAWARQNQRQFPVDNRGLRRPLVSPEAQPL
jgi:hypothetical protein